MCDLGLGDVCEREIRLARAQTQIHVFESVDEAFVESTEPRNHAVRTAIAAPEMPSASRARVTPSRVGGRLRQ